MNICFILTPGKQELTFSGLAHSLIMISSLRNRGALLRWLSGEESPTSARDRMQSQGQEDPLEKEMATHSSILAWRNLLDRGAWWTPGHAVARVGHDLATKQQQIKTVK